MARKDNKYADILSDNKISVEEYQGLSPEDQAYAKQNFRDRFGPRLTKQIDQGDYLPPSGTNIDKILNLFPKEVRNTVKGFYGLGGELFKDDAFQPLGEDPGYKGTIDKFASDYAKDRGSSDANEGRINSTLDRLDPALAAAIAEMNKGAVNDPALMAEAARQRGLETDAFSRADKERQIDPITQQIVQDYLARSKGYTPAEEAAARSQDERAIALERQAAENAAFKTGLRGGVQNDLVFRAAQDAATQRLQANNQRTLQSRTLGDQALAGAAQTQGAADTAARQGYASLLNNAAGYAANQGNILQAAAQQGTQRYATNVDRFKATNDAIGQGQRGLTDIQNARATQQNAYSTALNPFQAYLNNRTQYNAQLPYLRGQLMSQFITGGAGYGSALAAAKEANKTARENVKNTKAPTTNIYNAFQPPTG